MHTASFALHFYLCLTLQIKFLFQKYNQDMYSAHLRMFVKAVQYSRSKVQNTLK